MTQTCFDLQIDDRIAHLRMTRPEKRNSMIPEFWEELPRLIHDIDHNARARVIVISSTGPHFTGGLDIGAFMEGTEPGPQGARRCWATVRPLWPSLSVCRRLIPVSKMLGCL